MKIEFWSIGKQHDAGIKSAVEEYTKRLGKYCQLKWQIIPVPKNAAMLSENDLKKLEGKMILEWLDKNWTKKMSIFKKPKKLLEKNIFH